MTSDNDKMKMELFKTLLANPSNHISGLDVNKAINVVEKMMQAITNPKFGTQTKSSE